MILLEILRPSHVPLPIGLVVKNGCTPIAVVSTPARLIELFCETKNTRLPLPRTMLTDEYWSKLKPILHDCGIYNNPDLRLAIEGILYKLRAGCSWRDVPKEFGNWNTIYKNFNYWCRTDKFFTAFKVLSKDSGFEWV